MSTALLRKALLAISKMNTYDAFSNMTDAIACDPKNGDIYHHRGQVMSDQVYFSRLVVVQYFTLPHVIFSWMPYKCHKRHWLT